MKNRTNVMSTPASKRKGLDLTADLTATLQQFTVPKLRTAPATAAKESPQPPAAVATQSSTDAAAASAAAMRVAAGARRSDSAPAPAQAGVTAWHGAMDAAQTFRPMPVSTSSAARPGQPEATPDIPSSLSSAISRVPVAPAAENADDQLEMQVVAHDSSASQQTHHSLARTPQRAGERARTLAAGDSIATGEVPQLPLRRTVTDPPNRVLGRGEISPGPEADQVCSTNPVAPQRGVMMVPAQRG